MEFLYDTPPSKADMAEFGIRPEDFPPREFFLWPDNWPAFALYLDHSTQWRQGMGGPSGLDYNPIFHELDRKGLEQAEYDQIMDDVRLIEDAALAVFHKDR